MLPDTRNVPRHRPLVSSARDNIKMKMSVKHCSQLFKTWTLEHKTVPVPLVHHKTHKGCRCEIFKNSVRTSQWTQFASSMKSNRLVLHMKIMAPYLENHKKQILYEKRILFYSTAGSTYTYHRVLGTITETLQRASNETKARALQVACTDTVKLQRCS